MLTLYFFHFSFDSPHGQRVVAAGLMRRGDKAKVSFDCCYLLSLSPKSNVNMREGRQVVIPDRAMGGGLGQGDFNNSNLSFKLF